MCGLFGWIKPGATTQTDLDLADLFREGMVQSQIRGEDATGFYTPSTGVIKMAVSPDEFVDENVPDSVVNERFILGHCRKASSKYRNTSNVDNPKNAQPFESKDWVLIHNGEIDTPKIKGFNYTSQTDSEIIIAYTQKMGVKSALSSIDGSASVVFYDKVNNKITFWTNGQRPLAIAYYHNIIFYASTKAILRNTLKPKTRYQIFPDISHAVIYENEPLVYDLKKNRFTRQPLIKPRKKKIIRHSNDYGTGYGKKFANINSSPFLTSRVTLPRGCTQNPK